TLGSCACDGFVFFFSSRRRHTRSKRDWSSDVCSSDLVAVNFIAGATRMPVIKFMGLDFISAALWAAYSIFIGYFTAGWLEHTVLQIALALVFAAILGWILDRALKKFMRSRMERTPDQDDPEHQTGLDSNP